MKRSIYLDLTLPVFIDKNLVQRYSNFLKNSIKLLEKSSNLKFYFSINLFDEIHLDESFSEVIKVIKTLIDSDRAELVLSSSFNVPIECNQQVFVYDMLFSEYFAGYYLGMPRDFEGDTCIMVKNYHTFFFPGGSISDTLVDSINLMGYKRILTSNNLIDLPLTYKGVQVLPLNTDTKILFRNYITLESLKEYFLANNSSIFYLNMFETFNENTINIETNFSSFIYLLDKSFDNWELLDIDDENMQFSEKITHTMLDKLSNTKELSNYSKLKNDLIKNFSHQKKILDDEDFRRIPVWTDIENRAISSQNLFNFKLMTLMSSEVSRENILLKPHLKSHLNDIIDQLSTSEYAQKDLLTLISSFQDKINQK